MIPIDLPAGMGAIHVEPLATPSIRGGANPIAVDRLSLHERNMRLRQTTEYAMNSLDP